MPVIAEAQPTTVKLGKTTWWTLTKLAFLIVVVLVSVEAGRVLLGRNFHTIGPGEAYRGAQFSAGQLETLIHDYHIKTVINLRGNCNPMSWYLDQCQTMQKLNVSQEDICLSSARLPSAAEIRRLAEVLERAERPIFLHCWRGADRTGLAAAMYLLLTPGIPYHQARRQLGLRYGHVAVGKTGHLDDFFTLYETWLADTGQTHAPGVFRRWVMEEYQGGWYCCRFESSQRTSGPPRLGQPMIYQVRVRNTGRSTWNLHPLSVAGIQGVYRLTDDHNLQVAAGRFGLFTAAVKPGEAIDLTVAVAPVHKPGRYRLVIDMANAYHAWFFQTGSKPLEEELEIRE